MAEQKEPEAAAEPPDDDPPVEDLLRIGVAEADDVTVLTLTGELDENTAPSLRRCLSERMRPLRRLVVDTTGLRFCGASGLATFLEAHHRAREVRARMLIVVPPGSRLHRTFEIGGVSGHLAVVHDLDDARRS